jgi:hypothetical protein
MTDFKHPNVSHVFFLERKSILTLGGNPTRGLEKIFFRKALLEAPGIHSFK